MKIVIIEDEPLAAQELIRCIKLAQPGSDIVANFSSVKEARQYFKENKEDDLIFSDIQLGDGLSFKIFEDVQSTIPVIFCTAYDEYALPAFKAAGIDYILKPFSSKSIANSLTKYIALKERFNKTIQSYNLGELGKKITMQKQNCMLVDYKGKIIPINLTDIALFNIHNELTYLHTFRNEQYFINKTLDEVERIMPAEFYRVNRQFIVNQKTIKDISQYFGRKLILNLSITFSEKITVSKAKSTGFLAWLSGN